MPFAWLLLFSVPALALLWGKKRDEERSALKRGAASPPIQFPWQAENDENAPQDLRAAMPTALAKEPNPRFLSEFADSLDPDYPISARRLRARAKELSPEVPKTPIQIAGDPTGSLGTIRNPLGVFTFDGGTKFLAVLPGLEPYVKFQAVVDPTTSTVVAYANRKQIELHGQNIHYAIDDVPEARQLLDLYSKIKVNVSDFSWGYGGPKAEMPTHVVTLKDALENLYWSDEKTMWDSHAKRSFWDMVGGFVSGIFHAFVAYYGMGTKIVTPVLANIPGIGTAIAFVSNTAVDIAQGQDIDDALLDGVAQSLPGAPASSAAFKAIYHTVKGAIQGKSFDKIALQALPDVVSATGIDVPPELRDAADKFVSPAIDAAATLAQAEDLKKFGFGELHDLAPGENFYEQGAAFADTALRAQKTGQSVTDVLVSDLNRNMLRDVSPEAFESSLKTALDAIAADPKKKAMTPSQLADAAGVPISVANAALGAVSVLPIPKWMLDRLGLDESSVAYTNPLLLARIVNPIRDVKKTTPSALLANEQAIAARLQYTPTALRPAPGGLKTQSTAIAERLNPIPVQLLDKPALLGRSALNTLSPKPPNPKWVERQKWIDYYVSQNAKAASG